MHVTERVHYFRMLLHVRIVSLPLHHNEVHFVSNDFVDARYRFEQEITCSFLCFCINIAS